eukprot:jgi/Botrbrau1/21979/Bobra.0804s0001.1
MSIKCQTKIKPTRALGIANSNSEIVMQPLLVTTEGLPQHSRTFAFIFYSKQVTVITKDR